MLVLISCYLFALVVRKELIKYQLASLIKKISSNMSNIILIYKTQRRKKNRKTFGPVVLILNGWGYIIVQLNPRTDPVFKKPKSIG